jgi:hypothetical protein
VTTRWCRRPDVLVRRSLDAVVVLAVEGDELVTLAGTGPEVWDLLAEPRSLRELTEILAARHGAPADVVAADLPPVLRRLTDGGMVEVLDDGDGPADPAPQGP